MAASGILTGNLLEEFLASDEELSWLMLVQADVQSHLQTMRDLLNKNKSYWKVVMISSVNIYSNFLDMLKYIKEVGVRFRISWRNISSVQYTYLYN